MNPSPPGSFAGYSFLTWIKRNSSAIKYLVAGVGAYLTSLTGMIADPALNTLAAVAVGTALKLAADAIDYWLSEVPAEK